MLTIQTIRNQRKRAAELLSKRGMSEEDLQILDKLIELDDRRKRIQSELDAHLRSVNELSRQIGQLYKTGQSGEAEAIKSQVGLIKLESKGLETEQKQVLSALDEMLVSVPNIPHESVPPGNSEEDNQVVRPWGKNLPELYEGSEAHWDLGKKLGILDFELGTKLTGPGFPVFKGRGARLQRALIAFFLDQATEAGYEEIIPPLMVNEASARATGQLPDKEGQMYHITEDRLYMIPTAEVPITNIVRDMLLNKDDLPVKMTAYTPCFRREAGSYGADVKGLNRVHQFDKVEIVQICRPEDSYRILDEMVDYVSSLLDKLELPYRILRLCGGDLGFTSALTFDFEVFSAAQKRWLEVSSVSNFETYQSNRLKLRFKDVNGKKHLAHTLNGSALALARVMAALLENNQTPEGVKIPEALVPYAKFELIK